MRKSSCGIIGVGVAAWVAGGARGQELGTAFTYQGELRFMGELSEGNHDFEFSLWTASGTGCPAMGGIQVGSTQMITLTLTSGRFTVELDFGAGSFDGQPRWLEIAVCPSSLCAIDPAWMETLCPRQELTPAPHAVRSDHTRGINVDASGKVGIGTTTPANRLDVEGSAAIGASYSGASGAPANGLIVEGNVGIGMTNPSSKLDVLGTVTADGLTVDGAVSGSGFSGWDTNASNDLTTATTFSGDVTGAYNATVVGDNSHSHADSTVDDNISINNSRLFAPAGAGNVGIGTTTPTAKLEVVGNTKVQGTVTATAFSSSSPLQLQTAGITRIHVVDTTGDVGIGTTSPATRAEVVGPNTNTIVWAATLRNPRNATTSGYGVGMKFKLSGYGGLEDHKWAGIALRESANWGDDTNLVFYTTQDADGGTAPTEKMRIAYNGNVGIGTDTPTERLTVVGSNGGAGSEIVRIENTDPVDGDGLEIELAGIGNLGGGWNWATFRKADGSSAGAIQGNGSGGVELAGPGNDYAEWLPHRSAEETFEPGDIVGIFAGRISKQSNGADQVMVVSSGPIVLGNVAPENHSGGEPIAFVGQALVKVRGVVRVGQFIVASGDNDGVGLAMDGQAITLAGLSTVVGRAWQASNDPDIKKVNCIVGLPMASAAVDSLAAALRSQRELITSLECRVNALESASVRIASVEAQLAQFPRIGEGGDR